MKNIHDKMAARGVEALDDAELLTLLTEDGQAARTGVRRFLPPFSTRSGTLGCACGALLRRTSVISYAA